MKDAQMHIVYSKRKGFLLLISIHSFSIVFHEEQAAVWRSIMGQPAGE